MLRMPRLPRTRSFEHLEPLEQSLKKFFIDISHPSNDTAKPVLRYSEEPDVAAKGVGVSVCAKQKHGPLRHSHTPTLPNSHTPTPQTHLGGTADCPILPHMPQTTIAQAMQLAQDHQHAGRLGPAEQLCRQVLAAQPHNADALQLLGLIAAQCSQFAAAADLLSRAITVNPSIAEAHNNLAFALTELGKLDDAIASARRAIQLQPQLAQAHNTLGNALYLQRRFEEAILACREAVRLMPALAGAHGNLGAALAETRQLDQAVIACTRAVELDPNLASAWSTLGSALWQQGKLPEAETACRQAIRIAPHFAGAHTNLAAILTNQGKYDDATTACRKAMELQPSLAQPHDNLGHILMYQGQAEQAMESLQRAVELNPDDAQLHSSLVFASCYLPKQGLDETLAQAKSWAARHESKRRSLRYSEEPGRALNSKLRVGYVSADLRNHPVARFLLPLLEHHDRDHFEIHCFSDVLRPDDTTAKVRASADAWHDVATMNDSTLADQIRTQHIDILVDLAGHSARNRLLTFARKPSPIQVAWLGYPATTGLTAIDYRLTDAFADPVGLTDSQFTEQLIRLPQTAWCYQAPIDTPPATGRNPESPLTFGSFNNFAKVNESMLRLWAEIVLRAKKSRLVLKAASLASPSLAAHTRSILESAGLQPDQIELRSWAEYPASHLAAYNQIDIALDTFPYHGTTTTCEALWMGVPVVTLAGQTHRSRVGVSLLSNVGLPDLIAGRRQEYADIAVDLAGSPTRLQELRRSLRNQMLDSPLMNAAAFARDIEAAYRQMATIFSGVPEGPRGSAGTS